MRFGLPPTLPDALQALIKAADRAAAFLEATSLPVSRPPRRARFFGPPPKFSAALERDYLDALAGRCRARRDIASVSRSFCES